MRNTARIFLAPVLFSTLEVIASPIRQVKEIIGIQTGIEEVKLSLFVDSMILCIESPYASIPNIST